jgi:hypothetical protein
MLRRRDVARLLVKFCGLLVVLDALISLPAAAETFLLYLHALKDVKSINASAEAVIALAAHYFAQPFIYLVVGLAVIWWARPGTDGLAATEGSPDANDAPKLPEIEAILIAVLGVYFLCDGVTDLIRTGGWISINVIANGAPLGGMNWINSASYAVGFLKLGIGILLILRREGIVTLRRRIPEWVRSARHGNPFQGTTPDA